MKFIYFLFLLSSLLFSNVIEVNNTSNFKNDLNFLYQQLKKTDLDLSKVESLLSKKQQYDQNISLNDIIKENNLTNSERDYFLNSLFLDNLENKTFDKYIDKKEEYETVVLNHIYFLKQLKHILVTNNQTTYIYDKRLFNYVNIIDRNYYFKDKRFLNLSKIDFNSKIYMIHYYILKEAIETKSFPKLLISLNGFLNMFDDIYDKDWDSLSEYIVYKNQKIFNDLKMLPSKEELGTLKVLLIQNKFDILDEIKDLKKHFSKEENELLEKVLFEVKQISNIVFEKFNII